MSDPSHPAADQPGTDAGPENRTNTRPVKSRWVFPTLAITGVAVGIFIVGAGLFLLFAPSSWHPAKKDCCVSMEAKMKTMKDDMKNMPCMGSPASMPGTSPMPGMPSMSPMPNMPSMPPMPSMSSMPGMPTPSR